jgi:putative ABC transport system ATP-binding protein
MNNLQTANGPYTKNQLPSASNLISLRSVTKDYDTPAGAFTALRTIDLTINQGEFVAVVGKSGSGKSTLLNMITGIDRPTQGEIFINQTAVHQLDEDETAVWRGKNVGIVFQFYQLMPTLTVLENVIMPMDFCGLYSVSERRSRALNLLTLVDVADQANKFPSALSGGQQQRVAIARALANDPPLLVADEPTGNLDSHTADDVLALFKRLAGSDKTVVMVTHERDIAAQVDRVITLTDGQIAAAETEGKAAMEVAYA